MLDPIDLDVASVLEQELRRVVVLAACVLPDVVAGRVAIGAEQELDVLRRIQHRECSPDRVQRRDGLGAIGPEHGIVVVLGNVRHAVEAHKLGCARRGATFVDLPVAVVVDSVAELDSIGMDVRLGVVAVDAIDDIACGRFACSDGHVASIPVAVQILTVDECGQTFVYLPVAVVVLAIADLDSSGMNRNVVVVAVASLVRVSGRRRGKRAQHGRASAPSITVCIHVVDVLGRGTSS